MLCCRVERAFPQRRQTDTKSPNVLTRTSEEVDRPHSNKTSLFSGPDKDGGLYFPTQSILSYTVGLSPSMDCPSESSSVAECHTHHPMAEESAGPGQRTSFAEAILQRPLTVVM